MILFAKFVALAALAPAMAGTGQVSSAENAPIVVALCGGGTVAIALGGQGDLPRGVTPCCAKGCHSDRKGQKKSRQA